MLQAQHQACSQASSNPLHRHRQRQHELTARSTDNLRHGTGSPFTTVNRLPTFGTLPHRLVEMVRSLRCKAGRGKLILFTFSARFGKRCFWYHMVKYTLDELQDHHKAPKHTLIHTFILDNPSTRMVFCFFGKWKKLENLEETQSDMGRTCTKSQRRDETLGPWSCTTAPPCVSYEYNLSLCSFFLLHFLGR